jgi:LacI family transcriptional regulator
VVSAELQNPFYPALLDPLNAALANLGYRTILVTDRHGEDVQLEQLVDGSLDGVVLTTSTLGSELPSELTRRGVPHILLNRDVTDSSSDTCTVDNAAGAAMVADLLVGHGHRRIGAVFGPRDTSTGSERANAFRQRLVELGNPLDERLVRSGPFSESTGRAALADLATGPAPPTALFCGNDVIAFGVLNAARSLSIQVPAQLTVIGFDDGPRLPRRRTTGPSHDLTRQCDSEQHHAPAPSPASGHSRKPLTRVMFPGCIAIHHADQ